MSKDKERKDWVREQARYSEAAISFFAATMLGKSAPKLLRMMWSLTT